MKILQLYNNYKSGGGGETVMADFSAELLRTHGHTVVLDRRDNADLRGIGGSISAFVQGVYSVPAYEHVSRLLREHQPDLVYVYNLYPQFSPSAVRACNDAGVPVVMSVQNHQMTCPTAAHFTKGELCERCLGGSEIHAVLNNCKSNIAQSAGYALRSAVARKAGWYAEGVTTFLAISEAVRSRMLRAGYDPRKVRVLPNSAPVPAQEIDASQGEYVGFLGRITSEKGLLVLLEAARQSGVPVRIAGSGEELPELRAAAPKNVVFVGWLGRESVPAFYAGARFTVVPSLWPEPFGLVAIEAMSYGLPVIAARSGALPEIVEHQRTGLLYEPSDPEELSACMTRLWDDPAACRELGHAARLAVQERYSPELFYDGLIRAFEDALEASPQESASGYYDCRTSALP